MTCLLALSANLQDGAKNCPIDFCEVRTFNFQKNFLSLSTFFKKVINASNFPPISVFNALSNSTFSLYNLTSIYSIV